MSFDAEQFINEAPIGTEVELTVKGAIHADILGRKAFFPKGCPPWSGGSRLLERVIAGRVLVPKWQPGDAAAYRDPDGEVIQLVKTRLGDWRLGNPRGADGESWGDGTVDHYFRERSIISVMRDGKLIYSQGEDS